MGNGGPERASDYDSNIRDYEHGSALDRQVERLCRTLPPDVQERVRRFEALRRNGNGSGTFTALHAQRVLGGVMKNPRSVCERQLDNNVVWQGYPPRLQAALREQIIEDMMVSHLLTEQQLYELLEQQPLVQSWRESNYIEVDVVHPSALQEAELARVRRTTDMERIRVSAEKEKAWADKIYGEKANKLMAEMLAENRTYQKLTPELWKLIDDNIRQYFFVRMEPSQPELSKFIEELDIVKYYYRGKLSEALALHDAYQSLPYGVQQGVYYDLKKWFFIYVPISLDAITEFIERHPVVLDYYEKILNDGGFGANEVSTKDDIYDPLLEDTKPEGIQSLRHKDSAVKDEDMTDIVLDDDGYYRIVRKD